MRHKCRLSLPLALALGVLLAISAAQAGAPGTPKGRPFATLQEQIDALRVEVDALAARSSGLRVFDGDGNDVGRYAGFSGFDNFGLIYVFLEGIGVTAAYDVDTGELESGPPFYWFPSLDCTGPAYSERAGIAGLASLYLSFGVAVTGSTTQEIQVRSMLRPGPRGLQCDEFSGTRRLVPVEYFSLQDSPVPTQLPPLLYMTPAE